MTSTTSESETLTYAECLAEVETFMEESGICHFCSETCKGRCCIGCWEKNPASCHRNEGRRISCSVFLCSGLKVHLRLNGWENFQYAIIEAISLANASLGGEKYKNCFFTVHTPELQARCVFPKKHVTAMLSGQDKLTDIRQRLLWLAQQSDRPEDFVYNGSLLEEIRQRYDKRHHIRPIPLSHYVSSLENHHA